MKERNQDRMKIRIKYFTDKIDRLCYIDGKSDWMDLRAARDVELKAGEFALIPLGVALELLNAYVSAYGSTPEIEREIVFLESR